MRIRSNPSVNKEKRGRGRDKIYTERKEEQESESSPTKTYSIFKDLSDDSSEGADSACPAFSLVQSYDLPIR